MYKKISIIILLVTFYLTGATQGFLHVDGKKILDKNNNNIILRGIGTGNWLIQEGYMMNTSGVAGTQHEFRAKLEETIGVEKTELFYDAWLNNHFTKADVDSMAKWGFNSVRVAMHYKWFTPPIEDEPVEGEITWFERGFEIIDNLLSWCEANEMYLILDLHGAPGGQGKDSNISDYDSSKPSLWESELNKAKTVALWRKLAERYHDKEWLGGYDLINEVNWQFPEGNNSPLRNLYERITDTIRVVDQNHIIFIEGNWFANDFSGLTPAWDDNMVYSFHKYWTYNDEGSIRWVLDLREAENRPIWLGETGENSNTWFTNLVRLAEENNIGWSWWPVKKSGINNVMFVESNPEYLEMVDIWRNDQNMEADAAFDAVMQFAENHKVQNCRIQYDVIDALIRQPHTTDTKPFKYHHTNDRILAADYDLGRNGHAYFDNDTANYSLNTGTFTAWNKGWTYRSDGVDMQPATDSDSDNPYQVSWFETGEWLQYTINSDEYAAYELSLRTASEQNAQVYIEIDGVVASQLLSVPASGNWENFRTTTFDDIILPEGEFKLRIVLNQGSINFNHFELVKQTDVASVAFKQLTATTHNMENKVFLNVNKDIVSNASEINTSDFQLIVNNTLADISGIEIAENNKKQVVIETEMELFFDSNIKLSYSGESIASENAELENFTAIQVTNNFYEHHNIPGKVQTEAFLTNNGFELEKCSDVDGGLNIAFANNDDYIDYFVYVEQAGLYNLNFRVATEKSDAEMIVMYESEGQFINENVIRFTATGGWQNWETQTTTVVLPQGKTVLRLFSRNSEYNINWISFDFVSSIQDKKAEIATKVYPNPASDTVHIQFENEQKRQLLIYDLNGKRLHSEKMNGSNHSVNLSAYPNGYYILHIHENNSKKSILINKLN